MISTEAIREWRGVQHSKRMAERQYNFPVSVYRKDENGVRTLIRVEERNA